MPNEPPTRAEFDALKTKLTWILAVSIVSAALSGYRAFRDSAPVSFTASPTHTANPTINVQPQKEGEPFKTSSVSPPGFQTTREFALLTGYSERAIQDWCQNGDLSPPAVKDGNRWLVPVGATKRGP